MIRVTNNERAVLIRDNKTLRTTVECGRTVRPPPPPYSSDLLADLCQMGMTEKLRERIASERMQRQIMIGQLENEVAHLEAGMTIRWCHDCLSDPCLLELRISLEEDSVKSN
jgi:hypothetical protein